MSALPPQPFATPELPAIPARLVERLADAGNIVVFTGAGVSAESGIATFRQPVTGLWSRYNAAMLATPAAFDADPGLVWGWYEWRRAAILAAAPNAGHRAIATLARLLPRVTVVTQNVDDLHERAGNPSVVHLHGRLDAARCRRCAHPFTHAGPPLDIPEGGDRRDPPACDRCGAPVRPGVVWFGESLPGDAWEHAMALATQGGVFLTVGTSALVYPAAELPQVAARHGALVVQVNPEPTPLDAVADISLQGPAGLVLPALLEAVQRRPRPAGRR